ncbi:hypothetical protein PRZ48_008833 [Zasmidium cellare]|uniref:Uncharacterized protein n=1 Tax=Zasmidium cellare TaxID=395010 RepID=A0ABR0EGK8_ZASCE|nr:hypothetical protein PRZ48_008833 [Zasmidium cellare]
MAPPTSTNIFDSLATAPDTDIEGLPADVVLSKSQKKRMKKRERKINKEKAVNALLDAFDQDEESIASTDTPDYDIVSAHTISSASHDRPSPLRCSRMCGFCSHPRDSNTPPTTLEQLVGKELTAEQRARVLAEAEHREQTESAPIEPTAEPQMPKPLRSKPRVDAMTTEPYAKMPERSIQSLLAQYDTRIAQAMVEKQQDSTPFIPTSHRLTPTDWTEYARAAAESSDLNQHAKLHAPTVGDWEVVKKAGTEKPYHLETVTAPALSRIEEQLLIDSCLLILPGLIVGTLLGYEAEAQALGLYALVTVFVGWLVLICVADWTGWEVFEGGDVEGLRVVYDE